MKKKLVVLSLLTLLLVLACSCAFATAPRPCPECGGLMDFNVFRDAYGCSWMCRNNNCVNSQPEPGCHLPHVTRPLDYGCEDNRICYCDKVMQNAPGHQWGEPVVTQPATCDTLGWKKAECNNCDAVDEYLDWQSGFYHPWGAYTYNNDATCMKAGTMTATCSLGCGASITVEDPAHPVQKHKFDTYTHLTDATCKALATEKSLCAYGCGTEDVRTYGDYARHSYTTYTHLTDATCLVLATEKAMCDYGCGESHVRDYGDYADHEFTAYTHLTDATCLVLATEKAMCDYGCGKSHVREYGEYADHEFTTYTHLTDATCLVPATEKALCDYGCGESHVRDYGGFADHEFTTYTHLTDATCLVLATEKALCDYGCGKSHVRDYGEYADHKFDTYEETLAPTCTADGEKTAYCVYGCGETDVLPVPASGHSYADTIVPPTCTEEGYTIHTCSRCGDTYTDDVTVAIHHHFTPWTFTGEGHTADCTRKLCGYQRTMPCLAWQVTVGEAVHTVCPICGNGNAAYACVTDATVTGWPMPYGDRVVFLAEAPFDGALYALTVICEYNGHNAPLKAEKNTVTLPVQVEGAFRLVCVDQQTGEWLPVDYAYENGTLTFVTAHEGLFLIVAE